MAAHLADRFVCIGPGPSTESYLDINRVMQAAVATGCDALHPGYGFLAERPELAEACVENDIIFIGPDNKVINISANAVPYSEDSRPSTAPAAAVLELNGGRAAELGIGPGATVEW